MTRTHLPSKLRKKEIVASVIALSARQDIGRITSAQIAAAIDLSEGAIFRHFNDKSAIWAAVLDWTRDELHTRLDAAPGTNGLARLEAMMQAHLSFVQQYPGVPRILLAELQSPAPSPAKQIALELMQGYRLRVATQIDHAIEAGECNEHVDAADAAIWLLSMIQGLVLQALAMGTLDKLTEQAGQLFTFFKRGVEAGR